VSTIIGIDPGASGAIAILCGDDVTTHKLADLTEQDTWRLLAEHEPATVYLERVHAGPNMASSSAFKFGCGYGTLRMAAIAAGLRVVEVTPQVWQRKLGLPQIGGGYGENDKEKKLRNKAAAEQLYPWMRVTNYIADALLIAEYGRRQL
jgi:Holliday junction resolvasome RuvABC endonuclease subunit